MLQLVRGGRAKLSDLAAINHLWQVEIAVEAPFYVVDFSCLGLDEHGELVDDDFLIHFNRPQAPRGAIALDNASNNGAIFSVALEELPPRIRRLVFTASVGENPLPGGIVGAAFSLFGVNAEIGRGQLILSTPAGQMAYCEFSGEDFGDDRTLVLGEFYWRDEWRFVAAGQPLRGELGAFLRTLTDGPLPAPVSIPVSQPATAPLTAPARPPRPAPPIPTPPRPAVPVLQVVPATLPAPLAPAKSAPAPRILPQSVPRGGKLQDLIDAAAPGSTLLLQRGEYIGPITLDKPLILQAQGSAVWAKTGPVVRLTSPGVSLHDLDIENTTEAEQGVALQVETAALPLQLESVQLRGRLAGMSGADGVWKVPRVLNLGAFAARQTNEFRFKVEVPCAAELSCNVGGLEISPMQIAAGAHEITLAAQDIAPDTLLVGQIEVSASALRFIVPLSGQAQSEAPTALGTPIGEV